MLDLNEIVVGDRVLVTDQRPPARGVVVEVSTWKQVNGGPSEERCYRVRCDKWIPSERWIAINHVKKEEEKRCST